MRGIFEGKYGFIWLFLLFTVNAFSIRAQSNPQPQFDKANDRLQSGNYREALSIYKSLENQNSISGSLYLNMAISYVRLDSLGKAKYYFLKAGEFEETSDRAETGLQYVEERFSRQSAVLPKLPWERFFDWLGNKVGPTTLLGVGIILLNIGVFGFVSVWFFVWMGKYVRIGGLGLGGVGLLIILCSFYVQHLQNRYSTAVMVHQQANVLERPKTDAAIVSQAYEGYTFTVDHSQSSDQPGWSYVRMSNGLFGWISNNEIMIL